MPARRRSPSAKSDRRTIARPTFDQLQCDPELGVLTILSITLTIARFMLIATDPSPWLEATKPASSAVDPLRKLVVAIDVLAQHIDLYTDGIGHGRTDDDFPF